MRLSRYARGEWIRPELRRGTPWDYRGPAVDVIVERFANGSDLMRLRESLADRWSEFCYRWNSGYHRNDEAVLADRYQAHGVMTGIRNISIHGLIVRVSCAGIVGLPQRAALLSLPEVDRNAVIPEYWVGREPRLTDDR